MWHLFASLLLDFTVIAHPSWSRDFEFLLMAVTNLSVCDMRYSLTSSVMSLRHVQNVRRPKFNLNAQHWKGYGARAPMSLQYSSLQNSNLIHFVLPTREFSNNSFLCIKINLMLFLVLIYAYKPVYLRPLITTGVQGGPKTWTKFLCYVP